MSAVTHELSADVPHADRLRAKIEHAAHLLPAQGPITVFVHHNTLHAFEELPFHEAVLQGSRVFHAHPYLPEEQYRRELARGRIRREDLAAVLMEDPEDDGDVLIGFLGTRFQLRLAMLEFPLLTAPSAELRWCVAETDALRRFRPDVPAPTRERMIEDTRRWIVREFRNGLETSTPHDRHLAIAVKDLLRSFQPDLDAWSPKDWESFVLRLLWRICHQGVHAIPVFGASHSAPVRHRDWLHLATGEDSDRLVHPVLIRLCSSFLDQGLAHWPLPDRERGFYQAFLSLYEPSGGAPDCWLRGLRQEVRRLRSSDVQPLESVAESLQELGVPEHEHESFISATLLALRGWAGMFHEVEVRGDRVARPIPPGSLIDYLAVRLILERFALRYLATRSFGEPVLLSHLRHAARSKAGRHETVSIEQRGFLLFQLAQLRGWHPEALHRLTKPEWTRLVEEVETFSSVERRRVFQLAFERRYRLQTLDSLAIHNRKYWEPTYGRDAGEMPPSSTIRPSFQVITCIDDREESFRRHLEELDPHCETLSTAGFFNVAMYYRGAGDAHAVPLCPVIVQPRHHVREEVLYTWLKEHERRAWWRRLLGRRSHTFHRSSRTFVGGIIAALFGPLASFPLVARVLFPRLTARVRRAAGRIVQPPLATQLTLERLDPTPGDQPGQLGFSIEEMSTNAERLLRDTGLTHQFARLVILIGHGSSSLNNPHESAYNCGACGGGRGGPNARAMASMLNEPRVRAALVERGLTIPVDTIFLGAFHNTCDDSLQFFGLDQLPGTHIQDFDRTLDTLGKARERNAHERCRRFASAELRLSPDAALRHVEGRAEDLSQTRPEYNHATNAVCIVGRRSRTRGLFLDRRAFLQSYDPRFDDAEQTILTRILQAVIPVCAGINLEYYFSTVDVLEYGCGTKLPHNVTSLLGVMDGAASDLRTGLSAQMVEIHEPIRLLFVIETTPDAMLNILNRNPALGRLCHHEWVQLATLDPHSPRIQLLRNGEFQPYSPESESLDHVQNSADWYRNWRDHLAPAHIQGGISPHRTPR